MISCSDLFKIFKEEELDFFTGVPDSTFKDWIKFLNDRAGRDLANIIAVNECEACGIASGYNLATKKIPVIYMQNSGLGKIVNPHTSLLSKDVYSIPAIYMIGWRGEPEEKDEPQHKMMGRIMPSLLDVLEIPYKKLPDNVNDAGRIIREIKQKAIETSAPVALIIKKNVFEEYKSEKQVEKNYEMNREEAIKTVVDNLNKNEIIISTTGKCSRELFECRIVHGEEPRDFYTVGSMGCASSIALGTALNTDKKILILDGDGAALMQMGSFATIGHYKPKNLHHIIFDNNSHDSTGGQPTVSESIDFIKIASSCGYENTKEIKTKEELIQHIKEDKNMVGPTLTVVKINRGARKDLGRPTTTPIENKIKFMENLR